MLRGLTVGQRPSNGSEIPPRRLIDRDLSDERAERPRSLRLRFVADRSELVERSRSYRGDRHGFGARHRPD